MSAVDFRPLRKLGRSQRIVSIAGLFVLLVIAAFAVASTLDRKVLEPFLFGDSDSALTEERRIRFEEMRPRYRDLRNLEDDAKIRESRAALDQIREREISSYMGKFPPLAKVSDIFQRGSYCAWLALLINFMAALLATGVFWYFWNVVLFRKIFTLKKPEWIVLVSGLLVIWFPLRIYTEWYIGYYSFYTMKNYHVFFFLAVVAVSAYAFCVFRLAKSMGVKLFSVVGTGILASLGIVGKVQPELLGALAVWIEDLPFSWFIASMVIIIFALGAMVLSLLDLPELAATRELRRQGANTGRKGRID